MIWGVESSAFPQMRRRNSKANVAGDCVQMRQILMGTTQSTYEQPVGAEGLCGASLVDYNPMSQPCSSDFFKEGMYGKDTAITRCEHLRPGMYAGTKGGFDSFWKVPNYGNP